MILGAVVRGAVGVLAAACAVTAALSAQAPARTGTQDDAFKQAQEEFRKGVGKFNDEDWKAAADLLRGAIKLHPKEDTATVRPGGGTNPFASLGNRFATVPYLPYYFLGRALMAQGSCEGAVREWGTSQGQGVLKGFPQYAKVVEDGYKACEAKGVLPPGAFDPLLASTNQKYTDAVQRYKEAERSSPTSAIGDLRRANEDINKGHESLEDGTRTRRKADFDEASKRLDSAMKILSGIETAPKAVEKPVETVARPVTPEPVDPQILVRARKDLQDEIDKADRAGKALDAPGPALSPSMAQRRQTARGDVESARLLAASDRSAAALMTEATPRVRSAATTLNDLIKQRAALGSADSRLQLAVGSFEVLARRTELSAAPLAAPIAAEHEKLREQLRSLQRRFERAKQKDDVASLIQVERQALELKGAVETLIKAFGPLTLRDRGVSAALEEGVRLFLRGEYQPTVAALERAAASGESPLEAHVHLFRAAALYALYVRSGERDTALLTQALADIERCKQIDSSLVPDDKVFAPRFLAIFKEGRAPGAPTDPRP